MDPIYLLTPLKPSGHNFKGPDKSGDWFPIAGTLGELGAALAVDEKAKVDIVRSTPDPWAQVRSFADAVLHPTPLLQSVTAQWRGLIALFALKDRYEDRYSLSLAPVPLGDRSSIFASVMTRLLPRASMPAPAGEISHGWDRPILVRLAELGPDRQPLGDGRPIALLNPASLVAAGRDLDRLQFQTIPWMRNGVADPSKLEGNDALPPATLNLLAGFLKSLDDGLAELCSGGDRDGLALVAGLRRAIQAFRNDCLAPPGRAPIDSKQFDVEEGDYWGEGLPALYELLARPKKAKPPASGTSDCMIRLRDDLGTTGPFQGLVLLDPALETPARPANQITFWGFTTLRDALIGSANERQELRKTIAKAGYLLVEPGDFFTQLLIKMDDEEQPGRVGAHPDSLADCLLPLSPLSLLVFKPEELRDNVALNREGKLTLQLKLSGGPHTLARRYAASPADQEGKLLRTVDWGLGDFAVWPDFRSDLWSHYCARIDYSPNNLNRLRGRFALSGGFLSDRLKEEEAADDRAGLVAKWIDNRPIDNRGNSENLDRIGEFAERSFASADLTRFRSRNSGGNASEIQIARRPFEAAFFTIVTDSEPLPVPAGMALLSLRAIINPDDKAGDVGIDFGTTNTVACLNGTEPLRLEPRIVHPVTPANRSAGAAATGDIIFKFRDFLPPDQRALPTPTVLISRSLDTPARELLDRDKVSTERSLDDRLLIRHLIYFQPDFAADGSISVIPINEWKALLRNILFNLKWSNSAEMRDAARRYLRQLMLMISAEWTAKGGNPRNLRWHFSRPEHMGGDADFRAELRKALLDILPGAIPDNIQPLKSEGISAATYILSENSQVQGTRGTLNVILDIGGGTTDIAVWDNASPPRLLWSDSLRLAGGDFFTNHIMNHPELLDQFGLSSWSGIISQLSKESDADLKDGVGFVGELLFSGDTLGDAIDRQWSRVSGTDEVAKLKETAFVFLGGVAWYVGRQLRNLLRSGEIDSQALQDVAVALCGRGSNLFARLHGRTPRERTDISRLMLLTPFAAGETRPAFPQIQVSPFPKIEVAAGMIIDAKRGGGGGGGEGGASTLDLPTVDFSDVDALSAPKAPGEDIPADYLTVALQTGIEDLDPFLRGLAKAVGLKVTLEPEHRSKIVNGFAAVDREDAAVGRPRQAEFAVALKVLVDLMRARPEAQVRPKTEWIKPAV